MLKMSTKDSKSKSCEAIIVKLQRSSSDPNAFTILESTVAAEEDEESDDAHFLRASDRFIMSDYLFLLIGQFKRGRVGDVEFSNARRRKTTIPIGYSGLKCKHCGGNERGAYFPTAQKNLQACPSMFHKHLLSCYHCPKEIKHAIIASKFNHKHQSVKFRTGTQVKFFVRFWNRIREEPTENMDTIEEKEIVLAHMKKLIENYSVVQRHQTSTYNSQEEGLAASTSHHSKHVDPVYHKIPNSHSNDQVLLEKHSLKKGKCNQENQVLQEMEPISNNAQRLLNNSVVHRPMAPKGVVEANASVQSSSPSTNSKHPAPANKSEHPIPSRQSIKKSPSCSIAPSSSTPGSIDPLKILDEVIDQVVMDDKIMQNCADKDISIQDIEWDEGCIARLQLFAKSDPDMMEMIDLLLELN